MSILSRLFRHSVGYYVTAFAVGVVVTALALLRNGFSLRISWVDSLTVAGAVLILLGLLFLVAHFGAFDMFGYSFSTLGNRRYKNLYEYSRAKQEKRGHGGWTFMPFITVGTAFLLIGFLIGRL